MGFFDFFSKRDSDGGLRKHAERVANKRAQPPDRWESIHVLGQLGSPEAIAALLPRFNYYIDPSITDQEEKDAAFSGIVAAGEVSVEPVKSYLAGAESLSWALKMLDRLLSADQVRGVLLEQLGQMDTEYERDPQRKVQVLAELEVRTGPDVLEAVVPFLDDVNETARFHAVGAVLAQENAAEARQTLDQTLEREESMRVKARILDAYAEREWTLASGQTGRLPEGFSLSAKGIPRRG